MHNIIINTNNIYLIYYESLYRPLTFFIRLSRIQVDEVKSGSLNQVSSMLLGDQTMTQICFWEVGAGLGGYNLICYFTIIQQARSFVGLHYRNMGELLQKLELWVWFFFLGNQCWKL